MFRRRKKPGFISRTREFLWPKMGVRRIATYVFHRIRRLPGTPHSIAAGFACGAAVSFTPYIGLHFVGAALLAWVMGASLMASAVGTVVGNPWTFPFIWAGIYRLGIWMLGWDVGHALPEQLTLTYIFERPSAILLPMSLGAIPTALVVWFAFYWPVKEIVADYQLLRRRRKERRHEAMRKQAAAGIGGSVGKEGST